jgi:O-antigen/teichoic acid export membrane protein
MLVFSLPMIAFALSQYVIRGVDIVILRAYGTATQTGVYAVAYQAYSNLQSVATTSTIVLTPLFVSLQAANKTTLIVRYLGRIVPQITFVAATGAALCVPLLGVFVPLVFGPQFRGATHPLAILFVALVLFAHASFVAPILMLHLRSGLVGLASAAAAVVNVAADFVLIGPLRMGVVGPAIATTAGLAVICLTYQRAARTAVGSRAALRPWMLSPLLASLVPTLALSGTLAVICGLAAATIASSAVVMLAKPFERQDADLIAKLDLPGPLKRLALRALARPDC